MLVNRLLALNPSLIIVLGKQLASKNKQEVDHSKMAARIYIKMFKNDHFGGATILLSLPALNNVRQTETAW